MSSIKNTSLPKDAGDIVFYCRSAAGDKERFAARAYTLSASVFFFVCLLFIILLIAGLWKTITTDFHILSKAGASLILIIVILSCIIAAAVLYENGFRSRWPYITTSGLSIPVKSLFTASYYVPYSSVISLVIEKKAKEEWHTLSLEYYRHDSKKHISFSSFWTGNFEEYLSEISPRLKSKLKIQCRCHSGTAKAIDKKT